MNVGSRQTASALGVLGVIALLIGGAVATALDLREQQASVAASNDDLRALDVRLKRLSPRAGREAVASPFLEAKTITLAGAALQTRVETATASVGGRLVSSKVDVGGGRGKEQLVRLEAELTVAQADMQKLLFDLETGEPYLFVDSFEARAPDASDDANRERMRVSLTISGQWASAK